MALECPKCVGMMKEFEVGELEGPGIHIDQCQMCEGIWFDEGELDRVLQLKLKFEKTAEMFRGDIIGSEMDLKEAKCPRCKEIMERISSPNDDRVKMDYCLKCGGSWLDGYEIRLLQRGNVLKRAVGAVKKFFGDKLGGMRRQPGGYR